MLREVEALLPMACELFDEYWEMSMAMGERIGTWGDDQPAYYIASTGRTRPQLNSDVLRVLGPDGAERASFPPSLFRNYLDYEETAYSYAGQTSYQGQVMRANSLARMNLALSMGTPLADAYLEKFTHTFGKPATRSCCLTCAAGSSWCMPLNEQLKSFPGTWITRIRLCRMLSKMGRATAWWKRRAAR
jgi:coenzyme F420-reducing hydrogenase alpha subunit